MAARSLVDALAVSLRGAAEPVRDGALAALAEAYAAQIDAASPEARHEALKDLGPRLQAALVALGTAPGVAVGGGGGEHGTSEGSSVPGALSADELAARRQADALARLQQRSRERGA